MDSYNDDDRDVHRETIKCVVVGDTGKDFFQTPIQIQLNSVEIHVYYCMKRFKKI